MLVGSLVCTIPQVVHDDVEADSLIRLSIESLVVVGYKCHIVKRTEVIHEGWIGRWFSFVIDKPPSHIPIQVIWDTVE